MFNIKVLGLAATDEKAAEVAVDRVELLISVGKKRPSWYEVGQPEAGMRMRRSLRRRRKWVGN